MTTITIPAGFCPGHTRSGDEKKMSHPFVIEPDEDPINPSHYRAHPSGVECIQITEHMNFCLGNAMKYIWRADSKGGVEDLKKARWYINREIEKRVGEANDAQA